MTEVEEGLTLDQVSGMLHAASTIKSRIDELELTARMDHERIDHALEVAAESDRKRLAEIVANVEQFWLRRLEENPSGKKSVVLPWATIKSIEQQPEFVRDISVLTEWARSNGYVKEKTTEVLEWDRIRNERLLKGKAVPGVTVKDRPRSVTVKVD